MRREGGPDPLDVVDKVLGVAVSHVQTDELDLGDRLEDGGEPVKVSLSGPGAARGEGDGLRMLLGKLEPVVRGVVFVHASVATVLKNKMLE